MSTETNKALYRRLVEELFNQRNLDIIDELIAEDAIEHEQMPPEAPEGRDSVRWFTQMFAAAFPDWHVTVEDILAEGDKVAARLTMTGTHQGEFMGIPPTGNHFEITVMDLARIVGHKLVEHWGVTDNLGMMQQLGLIPEPEAAGI